MRARVRSTDSRVAKVYGGVAVCERWASFAVFLEDMGPRPDGMTLDRIDNERGYEPSNCRWATGSEQSRNRRSAKVLTLEGESMCVKAWAERLGVDQRVIHNRLHRGWTVERALTATKGST